MNKTLSQPCHEYSSPITATQTGTHCTCLASMTVSCLPALALVCRRPVMRHTCSKTRSFSRRCSSFVASLTSNWGHTHSQDMVGHSQDTVRNNTSHSHHYVVLVARDCFHFTNILISSKARFFFLQPTSLLYIIYCIQNTVNTKRQNIFIGVSWKQCPQQHGENTTLTKTQCGEIRHCNKRNTGGKYNTVTR